MMTSLRSKWVVGKAVRAGLAVATIISEAIREERVRQLPDAKTANRLRPKGLR
jgi:hypothetical protein